MKITKERLKEAGKDGLLNLTQLHLLGVEFRSTNPDNPEASRVPVKGWPKRLRGKQIADDVWQMVLQLRGHNDYGVACMTVREILGWLPKSPSLLRKWNEMKSNNQQKGQA